MPDDAGLATRPYDPGADAPALTALMNAIEVAAGGRATSTAEQLASLVAALVADVATDSTVVEAPDGSFAAAGFTTTPHRGGRRLFLTGGVHPAWRGRGLGRLVLARHLDRARAMHAGVGVPWDAHILDVPVDDTAAATLFERHGLRPARWWHEMSAAAGPRPAGPPEWDVRPYHPRFDVDLHAAHHDAFAANATFQARPFDAWAALTVRAAGFVPRLSHVAHAAGDPAIAGFVLTFTAADPAHAQVAHLGVRPAWRRRGLAGVLLDRVLDGAAADGRTVVALKVDTDNATGAGSVYERAGFRVERTVATWAITL